MALCTDLSRSQQGCLQALSSTQNCPESSPASKNATLQGRDDARLSSTLKSSYRQAQVSTDILGYTFRTTFLFSSRKRTPREFILSGTQHGSGMPGTIPTALTMLWMVAWLDGRTICKMRKESSEKRAYHGFSNKAMPRVAWKKRLLPGARYMFPLKSATDSVLVPLCAHFNQSKRDVTSATWNWPLGGACMSPF